MARPKRRVFIRGVVMLLVGLMMGAIVGGTASADEDDDDTDTPPILDVNVTNFPADAALEKGNINLLVAGGSADTLVPAGVVVTDIVMPNFGTATNCSVSLIEAGLIFYLARSLPGDTLQFHLQSGIPGPFTIRLSGGTPQVAGCNVIGFWTGHAAAGP